MFVCPGVMYRVAFSFGYIYVVYAAHANLCMHSRYLMI